MTKGQLIQTLTNRFGITKNESKRIVDAVFGSMTDALANGRNPKSGELIEVARKKLPYFKMCNELKSRVNT